MRGSLRSPQDREGQNHGLLQAARLQGPLRHYLAMGPLILPGPMPCSLRDPCACPLTFVSPLGSWSQPVLAVPHCPPAQSMGGQCWLSKQLSSPSPCSLRQSDTSPRVLWRGGFILCWIAKVRQSCQGALCIPAPGCGKGWSFSPVWDTRSSLEPPHRLPCKARGLEDAPRDVLPGQRCPLGL